MRRMLMMAALLYLSMVDIPDLRSQSFEDLVSNYRGENGKGYMQPLAETFGAALNSGLYHTARIPKTGFNLYIGFQTMLVSISDDQKTFTAKTQDQFVPEQTAQTPTIFGSNEGASVTGNGGTAFLFPGGMDIKRLPLAVPQVVVGSIWGTQAVIRFIQMDLDDNFERMQLLGYGLRHSLSQYLKDPPVEIAASFFMQKFEVGNIVEANAVYYGLQASRSAGLLTFYGGLGVGNSSMDLQYEYDSETDPETVRFELKPGASVRFNTGLALRLTAIVIHADYNFGSPNTLALGIGFGF